MELVARSDTTFISASESTADTKTDSSLSSKDKLGTDRHHHESASDESNPMNLECNIQAGRLTKVLDQALNKIKLAICLPKLIQEHGTLEEILTPENVIDVLDLLDTQTQYSQTAILFDMIADRFQNGKDRVAPEFSKVLITLNAYTDLEPVVNKMITDNQISNIEDFNSISSVLSLDAEFLHECMEYLFAFEEFYKLVTKQLNISAAEEILKSLREKKLEIEVPKLAQKIKEYLETLRIEQEQFDARMKLKKKKIVQLEIELANSRAEFFIKLNKSVRDSDREMVLMTRNHVITNVILKEEEHETRNLFQTMLRLDLDGEKSLRNKRMKSELQVTTWIAKYDTEMSIKNEDLEVLDENTKDEKRKIELLKETLEEQDKLYYPLMQARDDEYHQEMTNKMTEFLKEHATLVIQSAYAQVLSNRKEKKKLNKLWKKILKERERAERKEELERLKAEKLAKKEAKEAKKAAKEAALKKRQERMLEVQKEKAEKEAAVKAAKAAAAAAEAEAKAAAAAEAKAAKEAEEKDQVAAAKAKRKKP